jgi:hypothetical protein
MPRISDFDRKQERSRRRELKLCGAHLPRVLNERGTPGISRW